MSWFIKKRKIKSPTLKEIEAMFKNRPHPPYFDVLPEELILYEKSVQGAIEKRFKLPLRGIDVTYISRIVKPEFERLETWDIAKKAFEKAYIKSLRRYWGE